MSNYLKATKPWRLIFITMFIFALVFVNRKVPSEAASFNHAHGDGCYGTVSGTCYNHRLRNEYTSDSFYCDRCGYVQSCHVSIWWDDCLSGLERSYDVAYTISCRACGNVLENTTPEPPGGHSYSYRGLVCGKNESTKVANLTLEPVSIEPTNGPVIINAGVNILDGSFALATEPYDFGEGYSSEPTFQVEENGTYTVNIKDSKGRVVPVSVEVTSIDKTAPVITSISKSTEDWIEEGLTISVAAEDEGFGLPIAPFSFNGGDFVSDNSFFVRANGDVRVAVRDLVGNVTTEQIHIGNIGRDPAVVAAERAEAERIAAEKAAAEQAEQERFLAEQAEKERLLAEKLALEKAKQEEEARALKEKQAREALQKEKLLAKAGLEKEKEEAALKASVSGNEAGRKDVSENDVSGNNKNDVSGSNLGGLIKVTDLTDGLKKKTDEVVNVDTYDSLSEFKEFAKEEGLDIEYAKVGFTTLKIGAALLILGVLFFSFFNYIYVYTDGHVRIVTLCKVKKEKEKVIVIVPKGKLKNHGKHLIYFSLWNKFLLRKNRIYVRVTGDDELIMTDESVAFIW